jgi:hypothetical protein
MPRETSDRGGIARTDVEGEAAALGLSRWPQCDRATRAAPQFLSVSCTGRSKYYFYVTKYRD